MRSGFPKTQRSWELRLRKVLSEIGWTLLQICSFEHKKSIAFGPRILCLGIRWLFIVETEEDMKTHNLHFNSSMILSHKEIHFLWNSWYSCLSVSSFLSCVWLIFLKASLFHIKGTEHDHSYFYGCSTELVKLIFFSEDLLVSTFLLSKFPSFCVTNNLHGWGCFLSIFNNYSSCFCIFPLHVVFAAVPKLTKSIVELLEDQSFHFQFICSFNRIFFLRRFKGDVATLAGIVGSLPLAWQ